VLSPVAAAIRRVRLALWAAGVRARLRRHGVKTTIEIGDDVRFHTLPHLELDPSAPTARGGSLALRVGPHARLGRDLTIDVRCGAANVLELGEGVLVQSWCRLQLHGGSIAIGPHTHVRDNVQCKSKSTLTIGERVVLSRDVIVHATAGVAIGDDCGIGERTSIIDSDHELDGSGGAYLQAPLRTAPIAIGCGVALGANCVVLRGTRMGDGSALAAGSVLNGGEVPDGKLAAGAPARPIKNLRD
jgi:acetyltransferase-like isoleucine patch superfamily enzyme